MNVYEIKKFIEESQQHELPCILCRNPTRNRGMWMPNPPMINPENGKERAIIYPLCDNHIFDSETCALVETVVMRNYQ